MDCVEQGSSDTDGVKAQHSWKGLRREKSKELLPQEQRDLDGEQSMLAPGLLRWWLDRTSKACVRMSGYHKDY